MIEAAKMKGGVTGRSEEVKWGSGGPGRIAGRKGNGRGYDYGGNGSELWCP